MFKNNRGFTLIEMLIVLLIISVLIILVVPNLGGRSAEVNETGCEALIATVQAQVDAYYVEHKEHPEDLNELESAGFIRKDQKECPNNKKLEITVDENNDAIVRAN